MERHGDHERLIVDYLLGALPEADLERFERRFLEDEILFEDLQEIEDELIDDYVSGALTAEQRALFEQYFLRSPQRREKLQFAREITEHARVWKSEAISSVAPAEGSRQSEESRAPGAQVLPFKRWSRPVPARGQWAAIAAALLIAVGSGFLWLKNRELRRELLAAEANSSRLRQEVDGLSTRYGEAQAELSAEQGQTQTLEEQLDKLQKSFSAQAARKVIVSAFLSVEYLVGSRGGEKKVKTLEMPSNAGMVRLAVEFEKSRFEIFKIALHGSDGGRVWTHGGLKARLVGSRQSLMLAIPAESLPAGNYEITVNGVPANGPAELVGRYFIRVERRQ